LGDFLGSCGQKEKGEYGGDDPEDYVHDALLCDALT
jgi:hypothetical protein